MLNDRQESVETIIEIVEIEEVEETIEEEITEEEIIASKAVK
jgi:hypothetical protein